MRLFDMSDGNAQYLNKIKDNTYDFVYSSHCLEHMKDIDTAFINWLRVCREGGYLYLCVPHERWYEKGRWPSAFNSDHKWSFTADRASDLPKNIVLKTFVEKYAKWVDVIEISENLQNYDFDLDPALDQTLQGDVTAQIDVILYKKRSMNFTLSDRVRMKLMCARDYFIVMLPVKLRAGFKDVVRKTPFYPAARRAYREMKKRLARAGSR